MLQLAEDVGEESTIRWASMRNEHLDRTIENPRFKKEVILI
jgi:hypothetical protein